MKSEQRGKPTSDIWVTRFSPAGFWLSLAGRQLFVSFQQFPWFARATIPQLSRIEWPTLDHLYWPDLDIDLSVESIEHPERFPLVSDQS
jgi:hypothetical protein